MTAMSLHAAKDLAAMGSRSNHRNALRLVSLCLSAAALLLAAACTPSTAYDAGKAVATAISEFTPPDAGRVTVEGHVNQRRGVLSTPLAYASVELLQHDQVIATASSGYDGHYYVKGLIQNGLVQLRIREKPEVCTFVNAQWQRGYINGVDLVVPE